MFPRFNLADLRALAPVIGGVVVAIVAIIGLVLGLTHTGGQGGDSRPPTTGSSSAPDKGLDKPLQEIPAGATAASPKETTEILSKKWIPTPGLKNTAIIFRPSTDPAPGYYVEASPETVCNGFGVYLTRHDRDGQAEHTTFSPKDLPVTKMGCPGDHVDFENGINKAFTVAGGGFYIDSQDSNVIYYGTVDGAGAGAGAGKGLRLTVPGHKAFMTPPRKDQPVTTAIPASATRANGDETSAILKSTWIPQPSYKNTPIRFDFDAPPRMTSNDEPLDPNKKVYYVEGEFCNGLSVYLERLDPTAPEAAMTHSVLVARTQPTTAMGCEDGRIEYEDRLSKAFNQKSGAFWVLPDDPNTVYFGNSKDRGKGLKLVRHS
ncbi:hypothetical protein [Corynebacterium aquatimens]|uniref:META domain-containing protein n=1 Tax=Corynebacterium aquatimens TaxID=1190508 RepID=A0A931E3M5_9CORY|nr:hypothetical protein [Corynebacterium aquatimens]MBG6121893.1 hypothetical protein [Corynebacterium aquatimens]WJY65569.1 hypothetical protein CAQUA_04280 [Corynebacterium aquatimens]